MMRSLRRQDATMGLWRARDVYYVHAVLRGLLVLFWGFQLLMYAAFGYWWLGPLAVGVQWLGLWVLGRMLRWLGHGLHRALWWAIDRGHLVLVHRAPLVRKERV